MTGLVQIFGSSPAVQPNSQAFRVFTFFPAVFPSPATPEAGPFLPFAPFGTRWLQQIYFCSFKMLNGSLLFTAKTLSMLLAHLFFFFFFYHGAELSDPLFAGPGCEHPGKPRITVSIPTQSVALRRAASLAQRVGERTRLLEVKRKKKPPKELNKPSGKNFC